MSSDYKIEFLQAKDGNKTCRINNLYIHSAYAPEKEAEKYAENVSFSINPEYIFIAEPALSYSVPFLKKKYPYSKIIAIRYNEIFEEYNSEVYFSIPFYSINDSQCFEDFLFKKFNEVQLLSSVFVSWQPSEKIFSEQSKTAWHGIHNAVTKARTILVTRGYFEKKWLINTCNFLKYSENFCETDLLSEISSFTKHKSLNKPVVIAGSGPSLQDSVPFLKKYRDKFFLLAVSSSISVLNHNGLYADLYLSTDGGFYAGKHLESLLKNKTKYILAVTPEACCQKEILSSENIQILPLAYEDGISRKLIEFSSQKFYKAERNGTVTGTALRLAESMLIESSNLPVFLAGVDLSCSKGFQHSKPNRIETDKFIIQNRMNGLVRMTVPSEFGNESLKIYEDWFKNVNSNHKIYRIINNPKNSLGKITDISCKMFETIMQKNNNSDDLKNTRGNHFTKNNQTENKNEILKKIKKYIQENSHTEFWYENIFPLDYVAIKHSKDENEKITVKNALKEKNNKFLSKIFRILDIE